jgi:RimJ/RimL family protein N-acetyltransferase
MGAMVADLIETSRLRLVPLRPEHAMEMAAVLADPALYTYTGGTPPRPEELRARYERWSEGSPNPGVSWLNWVIWVREQRRLAGTVQATISSAEQGRVAEVAWIVGGPWQGRGIATEAARALVDWLRRQPVDLVVAHIHPDHDASSAVAAAVGLAPTAHWQDRERRWLLAL